MADAGTLYVTGLATGSEEEKVKEIFAQYGAVKSIKVLPARSDKTDQAAIISMENPDQAKWLIENVSGKIPQGMTTPVEIKLKAERSSQAWGKGFGKGWGMFGGYGGWGGKGWGKGSGKGWGEGLSSFPAERKVWVGNVPEGSTFQEIQEHFGGAALAKFATVMKGKGAGTAGIAFPTPEDATAAIEKYNGLDFKGSALHVDVWTKKEKEPAGEPAGEPEKEAEKSED